MDGVRWLAAGNHFELGCRVLFARGLESAELVRRLVPVTPVPESVTRLGVDAIEGEYNGVVMSAVASAGWAFGIVEGVPLVERRNRLCRHCRPVRRPWSCGGRSTPT